MSGMYEVQKCVSSLWMYANSFQRSVFDSHEPDRARTALVEPPVNCEASVSADSGQSLFGWRGVLPAEIRFTEEWSNRSMSRTREIDAISHKLPHRDRHNFDVDRFRPYPIGMSTNQRLRNRWDCCPQFDTAHGEKRGDARMSIETLFGF